MRLSIEITEEQHARLKSRAALRGSRSMNMCLTAPCRMMMRATSQILRL